MAFLKAPESPKENVCIKSMLCYHLPYLLMILIVKITLDSVLHI